MANPPPEPNLIVCGVLARSNKGVTRLPRKPAKHIAQVPVPETDTRGRVEYTKALERFTVKELGKMAL